MSGLIMLLSVTQLQEYHDNTVEEKSNEKLQ